MDTTFIQFVNNNDFRLIFFILVGLFISKNGFAQGQWNKNYVQATFVEQTNCIVITTRVYDFPFGPSPEGYLEFCNFEAYVDNNYFTLMQVQIPQQKQSNLTEVNVNKKFKGASIIFTNVSVNPDIVLEWPERLSDRMTFKVPTFFNSSLVILRWNLGCEFKDVRYFRISGRWRIARRVLQRFYKVVYNLNKPDQDELNSNNPGYNHEKYENDPVNILKNSEAIVIEGADPDPNIKVYSNSGVQIKSVISDNDVVNIKLPAKQVYIVHVGKSRFKVAL